MALSDDDAKFVDDILKENELLRAESKSYYPNASPSFNQQQKPNLVEYQLSFNAELTDIERVLRCDMKVRDERTGKEQWVKNPNKDYVVFNELGVNDISREIRMFLNKNMVLSNYNEEEIKLRVRQFGHELRGLIFNNYEIYGIDNDYKMNNFAIIVISILQMVESAYRRSMGGEERRDLNQMRVVSQNEPLMPQNNGFGMMQMQSNKSILKPWTWGR